MQRSTIVWSAVLALLFMSLAVILPVAAATQYEGNDNFEFGYTSGICGHGIPGNSDTSTATLQSTMQYNTGDPSDFISLQYNPDKDASLQCQTGPWYGGNDWFQSGIIGASKNNCGIFTIEVYNIQYNNGSPDWSWNSNGGSCTTINKIFLSGAQWSVSENTYACLTNCGSNFEKISSVSFSLVGASGGGSYYYTENTPLNWYWLRSNICWCGVTESNTVYNPTFTGGNGVLNDVGPNINIIGPPVDIETAENSNMLYTCPSQSGNTITQAFLLTYSC